MAVMRRSVATLVLAAAATSSALTLPASARIVTPLPTATPAPLLLASSTPSVPAPSASGAAVAWGVCGFLGILASAIKRLAPIALQPLLQRDLSWLQWGCYGGAMGFFAYVEGYGAFQKKFSPMVVERAMTLKQGASPMNVALAPFYSMGLMHATKKRKIVSWSVSLSVAMIVGIVKRLPCAPRCATPCSCVRTDCACRGALLRAVHCVTNRSRARARTLPCGRPMAINRRRRRSHGPYMGRGVHYGLLHASTPGHAARSRPAAATIVVGAVPGEVGHAVVSSGATDTSVHDAPAVHVWGPRSTEDARAYAWITAATACCTVK